MNNSELEPVAWLHTIKGNPISVGRNRRAQAWLDENEAHERCPYYADVTPLYRRVPADSEDAA